MVDREEIEKWTEPKTVCPVHTDDPAVRDYIESSATAGTCDYCNASSEGAIAVHLSDLALFVLDGIESEWASPDDEGLPYESADGGYLLAEPLTTYDLLSGEGDLEPVNDDELREDIIGALGSDVAWVQRDFYRLPPAERLRVGYRDFSEQVRNRHRYFFRHRYPDDPDEEAARDRDETSVSEILGLIAATAGECGFLRELPLGEEIFRARVHGLDQRPDCAGELGAPPACKALSANRMSPAGISMFYGARGRSTAIAEAKGADPKGLRALTVGRFKAIRPLCVLDLTTAPSVPTAFDPIDRDKIPRLAFLRHFIEELGRPIVRDRSEHVEYVPTQVVCEYLRTQFFDGSSQSLDGLLYRSVRSAGGTNVVLFIDNDGARDPDGSPAARRTAEAEKNKLLPGLRRGRALIELAGIERMTFARRARIVAAVRRSAQLAWPGSSSEYPMAARLKYVDPNRPRGLFSRVYAALANTRLGRFMSINVVWKVDPYLMRATRGRLGMGLVMPTALLETRGARSGAVRRNVVIYFHDGDRVTIVASKLGYPNHPAWFHNLRADPDVTFGGIPMRATVVGDEAERDRLWALADRVFAPYAAYRGEAAKANRAIPIVQLTETRARR